jgi:hypothetical protein
MTEKRLELSDWGARVGEGGAVEARLPAEFGLSRDERGDELEVALRAKVNGRGVFPDPLWKSMMSWGVDRAGSSGRVYGRSARPDSGRVDCADDVEPRAACLFL